MVAMSDPLGSLGDRIFIKCKSRSAVESKAAVSREMDIFLTTTDRKSFAS
jgi:hypothetical protein